MSFELFISYSQIAVFQSQLEQPFNSWTHEHVQQGFAWRSESVSFRTLKESGWATIEFHATDTYELKSDAVRAIRVPFVVPDQCHLEIASITEGRKIQIPPGEYALVFETGLNRDYTMWCCFSFVKTPDMTAEILRVDPELIPPNHLLMTAQPAD